MRMRFADAFLPNQGQVVEQNQFLSLRGCSGGAALCIRVMLPHFNLEINRETEVGLRECDRDNDLGFDEILLCKQLSH